MAALQCLEPALKSKEMSVEDRVYLESTQFVCYLSNSTLKEKVVSVLILQFSSLYQQINKLFVEEKVASVQPGLPSQWIKDKGRLCLAGKACFNRAIKFIFGPIPIIRM